MLFFSGKSAAKSTSSCSANSCRPARMDSGSSHDSALSSSSTVVAVWVGMTRMKWGRQATVPLPGWTTTRTAPKCLGSFMRCLLRWIADMMEVVYDVCGAHRVWFAGIPLWCNTRATWGWMPFLCGLGQCSFLQRWRAKGEWASAALQGTLVKNMLACSVPCALPEEYHSSSLVNFPGYLKNIEKYL